MKNFLKNKIIIGTRSLSGDLGSVDKKKIFKTIEYSISKGFNHFDTAPFYGRGFGDEILKNFRKEIIVDTKCGYNSNFTKKTFFKSDINYTLDRALKNFDKINIFYIHNPRDEVKNWNKIIDLMLSLKKEKLIKFSGISLARGYYFNQKILNNFDVIQDDVNVLRNLPLLYLNKFLGKIISRSVFASGCLSGKLNKSSKFEKDDYRFDWLKDDRLNSILNQISQIKKIHKGDIRKLALGYVLKKKKIKKMIIGIKNKSHIDFLCRNNFSISNKVVNKIDYLNRNFFSKENMNGY